MDTIATTASDRPQPCCVDGGEYRGSFLLRWYLILCFSLLIAALAGAKTWFLQPDTYTATALVRVKAKPHRLVFEVAPPSDEREFERYKNTQQQHIQNRYILEAAIRQVDLAMKEAQEGDDATKVRLMDEEIDPADWLAENLKTDYPGEAEYLRIRLTRDDPKEAAILVNAVVDAYLEEVVGEESRRQRERVAELDDSSFAMEEELRTLKSTLISIVEQTSSTPSPTDIVNQSIEIERLRNLCNRQFEMQDALRSAQREMKLHQTKLKNADNLTISENELDVFAESDRSASQLALQQDQLHALIQRSLLSGNERSVVITERLREYRAELSAVTQQLAERRAELKEELRRQRQAGIETESTQLQVRIVQLAEQLGELEADIDMQEEAIDKRETLVGPDGGYSRDVETLRAKIALKESLLATIDLQREKLLVELGAYERVKLQGKSERHQSRITLMQPAVAPKSPDERTSYSGPALAAAIAFFVAAGAMIAFGSFRRARRRRLTTGG